VGEPRILGAAAVVPLAQAKAEAKAKEGVINEEKAPYLASALDSASNAGMKRDDEIEAVGMRVAMQYERAQGWQPEDVSGENHGFDVRSTQYGEDGTFAGIRYIEVKARAQSGAIRLSSNEWKKARHFDDKFWLYIVTRAGSDAPQLHRVQNPAAHFTLDEDIFVTGFIIPEEKWVSRVAGEVR